MTLADALTLPHGSRVVLARVSAGERLAAWVDNLDGTWTAPLTHAAEGYRVEGLEVDGVALDLEAWSWDAGAGTVTADEDAIGGDPREACVVAEVAFYWSNRPREVDGIVYDPRLEAVPSLSLRVEERFGELGQVGTGRILVANGDALFDRLAGLVWREAGLILEKDV